ncbi:HAD hydrolase-like protein [Helicobacter sp. T3_23-1059]
MIADFLAQNYPQIRTIRNSDFATTNNMYSLYLALRELPLDSLDTLFINNGDCLYESQTIKDFADLPLQNTIAIQSKIYNDESMKISLGTQNQLINIAKNIPQKDSNGVSIDLYKFSRPAVITLFDIIKDFIEIREDLTQWSEVAFPPLFRQVAVSPHDIGRKKWVEVDNVEDLALADRIFSDFDLSAKKALICDMDGTLYVGDKPLQKSIDFIKRTKQEIFFLTNNTSKTPSDYVEKLASFGICADLAHIITPLNALIDYLQTKSIDSAYLVANERVAKYVQEKLPNVNFCFDKERNQAVILTFDTQINYEKLQNICDLLHNTNAKYIATHSDIFCPSEYGALPDIGSFVALLEMVAHKIPSVVLGKPNVALAKSILERFSPQEIAVIGDRIYTDKELADNMGCDFVLTLTGETSRADLQDYNGSFPKLVVRDLGEIDLDNRFYATPRERERERE